MNEKIIKVLNDMATFEEFNGRKFPALAYKKAIPTIKALDHELTDANEIKNLPGIGNAIYTKIDQFLRTGSFPRLEEYKVSDASKLKELAEIKGIGMNKAKVFFEHGIKTLDDLRNAVKDLAVGDEIPGTGINYTNAVKIGLTYQAHTNATRMTVEEHNNIVDGMLKQIKGFNGVSRAEAAGSARRYDGSKGYTIGDIDIVIGLKTEMNEELRANIESLLDEVLMSGPTKISGIKNKRQVDFRLVKDEDYEALLLTETGPMSFNIVCRKRAMAKGWKLNEYGLFTKDTNVCLSKSEREILQLLGLGWVDPKDRKNIK